MFHEEVRPEMRGATNGGNTQDRLAATRSLPRREFLQRVYATVIQIPANDKVLTRRPRVRGVPPPGRAPMSIELETVKDVFNREIHFAGRHDLARLYPAAALDQLEVEALVLAEPLLQGDVLLLIAGYGDRIRSTRSEE